MKYSCKVGGSLDRASVCALRAEESLWIPVVSGSWSLGSQLGGSLHRENLGMEYDPSDSSGELSRHLG